MKNVSRIEPVNTFRSCIDIYSEAWYEDYVGNAKEVFGDKPLFAMLEVYGGKVEGFFDIEERVKWVLTVMSFGSDGEMEEFVRDNGLEKIVTDIIWVDKNKGVFLER